jgi:purine-binding chemotaxis protein CheW
LEGCEWGTASDMQIVVFALGQGEGKIELGVAIEKVQEINRLLEITHIPETPEFVEGVVSLRGKIIPVVDLRKRLGLNGEDYTEKTRIIIFEVMGCPSGVIVDEVSEVLRVQETSPPPTGINGLSSNYIEGIAKIDQRLILIINLEEVFTMDEKLDLLESEIA